MEGIIKFRATRVDASLISDKDFNYINPWRQECYRKGYIGVGADGLGYGNISFRIGESSNFIISASATGGIHKLKPHDYSTVVDTNISDNTLDCKGEKLASSESLTHAAVYHTNSLIKAVLHIHNADLWKTHKDKLSTSSPDAEYGTKSMADAISRIIIENKSANGVIIMGGHTDGILSYGNSLEQCVILINQLSVI